MKLKTHLLAAAAILVLAGAADAAPAGAAPAAAPSGTLIPVQSFTLDNGLKVVMHVDRSDPVVAVSLNAHVGSARELPGRTGFAHLFEHLLFLESENLGKGGLDKMSARIGGSGANGSTSRDITDYLQTVPKDALEKMIWAEADKLGYFINTVTDPVLAKEKEVVKNEKRQSVDNVPYGQNEVVIAETLYPEGHPYSWPVIGSMADLNAATLNDVKNFYRRWYVPNNATLVIAGDFDPTQAKAWVRKYFAEIPRGPETQPLAVRPAKLTASKSLMHEDNFAQLPQLTLVWPTVEALNPDSYALETLFELLTDGKETPLNAVLVDEKKLTDDVGVFSNQGRVAGEQYLIVRAFDGVDLDQVKAALDEGFARFEAEGVDPAALARVKTAQEVSLYGQLGSVLGKASRLARYDLYADDPAYADRELAAIRNVTADDVMRVYRTYIKDRPFLATSFVPEGKAELALAGAVPAHIVEEKIVQGAETPVDPSAAATYARTPSSFDRSVEPPYGAKPELKVPAIWDASFGNGLTALGIEDRELPIVRFELAVDGGRYLDDPEKPGIANLLADMMTRGTARRTPAELEEALKGLGADIDVAVEDEHLVLRGQTLSRNFPAVIDIVEEIVLEPRWDPAELEIARAAVISEIQAGRAEPNRMAQRAFDVATYSPDHVFSRSVLGTEASVAAITMDDLKAFHARNLAPNIARVRLVGAIAEPAAEAALADLGSKWRRRDVAFPSYPAPKPPETSKVWFYDMPGAKQSVLAFGNPALRRADPDYYPATIANYILGGGGFASRLTQQLREGKGYTYGIRSGFTGGERGGVFTITSGVRSNVTLEAADLVKTILADYPETLSAADLEVTKSALGRGRLRAFETPAAKLGLLRAIGDYGLPRDYLAREAEILDEMSLDGLRTIAAKYVRPEAMNWVIVGDAATQAARLDALGFGAPIMLNDRLDALEK